MERKSIIINSFYSITYKLVNMLFPLISTMIISRVLSPDGVGKVSSAQNIVTYFTFIAGLGLPSYGTRKIARNNNTDSNVKINTIFTELFIMNFISTTLCIFLYYSLVMTQSFFKEESNLYYIVGMQIVLNYINVDWFYQGKEDFKYISIRNSITKLIMLFAIVLFVKEPSDYCMYAFIYCIAITGNNVFNIVYLKKYSVKIAFYNLNIFHHLKPVMIVTGSNIANELYTLMDTTMLTVFCTSEIVAYYSNSVRIVRVTSSLIIAIGAVLLPRLSYYWKEHRLDEFSKLVNIVFKVMLFLVIPCGVGMICVADKIVVVLFGTAFIPAIPTLKILSILFFVMAFSNLFGIQVLISVEKESKILISMISGATINIILNGFLIKLYAQNGVAIASVISEIVVMMIMYFYAHKYCKLRINNRFIISIGISTLLMSVAVNMVKNSSKRDVINLLVSLVVGTAVYFGVNFLLKNELLEELKHFTCKIK